MPKFRYSLDTGITWVTGDSAISPTIPSSTIDSVIVQSVGVATTLKRSLINLSLSSSTASVGSNSTINIIGATAGSTITGSVPDGMTLNSSARTITGAPTIAGSYSFTLTETLVDSANSPRVSTVSITVTSGAGWAIGLDRTPPYVPSWTRPTTFEAGVSSGAIPADSIDFATGNGGGAFADFYAWIDACNAANKPGALGQNITITTAEASLARRYLCRGIYGYGTTNPKITWTGRTTGSASQKALFHVYLEDITIRGVEFVDWGAVLAVGQKTLPLIETATFTASFSGTAMTVSSGSVSVGMSIYVPGSVPYGTTVVSGSSPNWVISNNVGTVGSTTVNVVDPQPYHTSTQPLTRIADPVIGSASGLHCPRLGRIATSGTFNISQIAIKRQIEGITAMGQASGGANNNYYFNDGTWSGVLETVTLFTGANCTTNAQIRDAINANTTVGLAHGYAAVLSLSGDVLITANTVNTKSFVDMVITQTGTVATFDVKTPAVTITHCTFTDCNMTYAALLDVSELGAVEFHKNKLPGTWSGIYAQVTRWGHLRAANNEWYDCLLSRSRPQTGRSGTTGAGMPTGSSLSEFNTFIYAGTDSPLMMRYMTAGTTCLIENNYAHDVESYNSTNTVNAAVFADIRNCWQRTSNGKINRIAYNRIVSVKGVRGAEDANALYAKPRGLDVIANYIEDVGAQYYATGTQDGSEFSNGFKNPGPWNKEYTSAWGTDEIGEPFRFLGNELVNMPPGIPPFKIDEVYTAGTIIEDNIIRNWRNYKNGVEQTSGSVAGGLRITDGHRSVSVKRNRFINCDPGPTDPSLLVNFHNLKEANNTTFTSSDFQIDNNEIYNDGSAHPDGTYPVYNSDMTTIRLNFGSNSPAAGFVAGIVTGSNRILTASGTDSGFRMRSIHTNRSETSVGTNSVSQVTQFNYLSSYGALQADYTATSESELTTILNLGSTTLNNKRIALASGNWAQRTITLAPSTKVTFVAQNPASRPNLIRWKIGAGAANLFFEDLRFVTDSWGSSSLNDVMAYNGTGTVGACTWTRCGFKGGYGGPGSSGNLWENNINPTGITRYPEYACILPVFDGTGAVVNYEISRNNVAGLMADGTYPLTFSNASNVVFSTFPTGWTMTVSGGVITTVSMGTTGSSNATTLTGVGIRSNMISWPGQNRMINYLKFGVGRDASSVNVTGLQSWIDCDFADLANAIKFTPTGGVYIEGCTFSRTYMDTIALGIASDGDTGGSITVRFNTYTQGFSAQGDPGDPHSDMMLQMYMDDQGTTKTAVDWGPVTVEGNVCFDGNTRGHGQMILMADNPQNIYYKDVRIVGNIGLSKLSTVGIQSEGMRNGYIYRNTIARFVYDTTENTGTSVNCSVTPPSAGWNPVGEQLFFDSNISESFSGMHSGVSSSNNIQLGSQGSSIAYSTVFTTPPTTAGGSGTWPTTREGVISAFSPTGSYVGKGAAGSDGYIDYTNRTINTAMEPVFVNFDNLTSQTAGSAVSSTWRKIIGGPTTGTYTVTNGTVQFADDVNGTNATGSSTSGTYTRGKYMRLNLTNSVSGATATTATMTFNGSWARTFSSTTASSASYPIVSMDSTTPDLFRRSSGSLGADSNFGTIALTRFKMATIPSAVQTIFGASSGTARIQVQVVSSTGRLRINLYNGTSQLWRIETASSVCDNNYHDILISFDTSQTSESAGRSVYIDGVSNSNAAATWGTGGQVVSYSTSINAYQFGPLTGNNFEIGAFYLNTEARVDLTNATERSKFSADFIGTNGTGPTGSQPVIFLVGNDTQWNAGLNRGSGGVHSPVGSSAVTLVSGSAWS